MPLEGPPPVSFNPLAAMRSDLRAERAISVPFPPGETRVSAKRTERLRRDPLGMLLEGYERYGPVFTMRVFHGNTVFVLGPEANYHVLVAGAENFAYREGQYRDLIGLLGDGLLTIDGEFHRRSRLAMLPVFHRESIAAAHQTILEETRAAIDAMRLGERVDLYTWTRHLAMRIALRALFGIDPDGPAAQSVDAAELFEYALGFYGREYALQALRGPMTPFAKMRAARSRLDWLVYSEIARRRRSGERGLDLLSVLLDARDEDGSSLSARQVRDEVMTLLFAGHDTSTSTIAFMFYELARQPEWAERLRAEQDEVLAGRAPAAADLTGETLPTLEMVIDETLRLYPPAWIGPRRSRENFTVCGVQVPGGIPVDYSSWISHRLPDVWPEAHAFLPERFAPAAKAALPRGAYIPFGGGSRTCIGMRFGQLEVRTIATLLLAAHSFELEPGYTLRIRQMPTISPRDGLPVRVQARARTAPAARATAAA